uniref:Ras GTPase-activating protein-binding protein 2 n=1 Tax=Ciona savignyi TaxID=51511 RepID=H2Z8K6_CIOSA
MVMMEKPSPIQVGREFVRQYYTLLNKAPELLYRFYSMNSSYVHGGRYSNGEPEKPVIGQTEIHTKIDSLDFHDCHTKIRQVDAHSTIGSGIVVQVTGELSNSGLPLRRFMQTFVLAPQGDNPYKFYVHNDIFRYQDEVFLDESSTERVEEEQAVGESDEEAQAPVVPAYQDAYLDQQANHDLAMNGVVQQMETINVEAPEIEQPEIEESPAQSPQPEEEREPTPPPTTTTIDPTPPPVEEEVIETPAPSKPFSWADLASKNTPARSNVQQGTVVKVVQPEPEPVEAAPKPARQPRANQRFNAPKEEDRSYGDRNDARRQREAPGGGGGGSVRYPDNQQIFVGNLPYDIKEVDLKNHFTDFGNVIEVRINHSHSNNPSFGFVIFENPSSVEKVLEIMPTQYKNNQRINIEEKKQRNARDPRRGGDSRRGAGDIRNRRGGGSTQMRRDRPGSRDDARNYSSNRR